MFCYMVQYGPLSWTAQELISVIGIFDNSKTFLCKVLRSKIFA